MLTFILGLALGACTTLITISLMVVAKSADQQMELMVSKE